MHELSMAEAIVETVIDTAQKNDAIEVLEVTIDIGRLTMLNPEQLSFMIGVITDENELLKNTKFTIEETPVTIECKSCGYEGEFEVDESDPFSPIVICPKCEGIKVSVKSGRECTVKNIQIEKEE
jgi:hydrogenase nickel incorporation protein HypA/HybF